MAQLAPFCSGPSEPKDRELGHIHGRQFIQAHQQHDHLRAVGDFLEWLRRNQAYSVKNHQTEERTAFVPHTTVTNYLKEDGRLDDILDALFHPDEGPDAEIVLRKYVAIFCILIEIGMGPAIEYFVKKGLHDQRLPFDPKNIESNFPPDTTGDGTFYRRFCEKQWRFCVPNFEYQIDIHFPDQSLLPLVEKRVVAEGGSAKLFEVRVHSSYNKLLPESGAKNTVESGVFALKTYYTSDAARYYETEVDAFRKLKRAQPHNPHLISFFGSYVHSGTYNVILEYADQGSLEQYFHNIEPPFSLEDISTVWESLFGILKGLESIHQVELAKSNAGSGILNGWHQDVKPKNILVFSNNESSPYKFTFKLTDLGLSHFQRTMDGEAVPAAPDSYGTSTYGAPECYRADKFWDCSSLPVNQDVDIWSIACVYSEAAVWMARSSRGLREYRQTRLATTLSISQRLGDAFHDGQKALDAIAHTHAKLVQHLQHLKPSDYVTPEVLKVVDQYMLQPAGYRWGARQLWSRFSSILKNPQDGVHMPFNPTTHYTQAIYQSPRSTVGSLKRPFQHYPAHQPPSHPPLVHEQYHFTDMAGDRRPTDPKTGLGVANLPKSRPRRGPNFPHPQHSSPEEMSVYEHEVTPGDRTKSNGPHPSNTHPDFANGVSTTPSRPGSQFGGPLGGRTTYSTPWQTDAGFVQSAGRPRPGSDFDVLQESANIGTQYAGTYSHDENSDRRALIDHCHSTPSTYDIPYCRGCELESPGKRPIPHTPQANQRHEVDERRRSLPPSGSPLPLTGSSHAIGNKSIPLSAKRSPPNHPKKRKKQRRTSNVPPLALDTALEWRTKKKECEKLRNRLRKREVPKLPGDWLMHKCYQRDHVFIIDNALSMKPHWEEMSTLFGILAYIVKKSDDDGIDLYFTMSDTKYNNRDTAKLVEIVNQKKAQLEGLSSINIRLQHVLEKYSTTLRNQIAHHQLGNHHVPYRAIKPLSVYVFTDGVWTPKSDPRLAIERIVDTLEELRTARDQVGIQFISFGQDSDCLERLERYDKGLNLKRDIVDHCPSNGDLWKMLFGAIDPEFDEPESELEESSGSDMSPSSNKEYN